MPCTMHTLRQRRPVAPNTFIAFTPRQNGISSPIMKFLTTMLSVSWLTQLKQVMRRLVSFINYGYRLKRNLMTTLEDPNLMATAHFIRLSGNRMGKFLRYRSEQRRCMKKLNAVSPRTGPTKNKNNLPRRIYPKSLIYANYLTGTES